MSFWAYMLHCRGGYFYVGHTDDLERRIAEHKSGMIPGFTADHLPVELVWSQDFAARDEARSAENQIKGWSRAKKLALIRGDWGRIATLAKGQNGPSTSSGKTEKGRIGLPNPAYPELVEGLSFSLIAHRDTPPSQVRAADARIWMTDCNEVLVEFRIEGAKKLLLPPWVSSVRRDDLWQTTCFEMFLMCADGRYFEFNFSPSTQWAIYAFDSYRHGMRPLDVDVSPHIEFEEIGEVFSLEADVDLGQIPPGQLALSFSAVIEETDGTKSYWALAHPPGAPDFHHPACFTATLPAPNAP